MITQLNIWLLNRNNRILKNEVENLTEECKMLKMRNKELREKAMYYMKQATKEVSNHTHTAELLAGIITNLREEQKTA